MHRDRLLHLPTQSPALESMILFCVQLVGCIVRRILLQAVSSQENQMRHRKVVATPTSPLDACTEV